MTVQVSPEMGEAMKLINSRPPVFTLCGSARFEDEFHNWNRWLTFAGVTVLSLSCFPSMMGEKEFYTTHEKALLDQKHRDKIDISNAILVLNRGGYIGQSTMGEILYALAKGKKVFSIECIGVCASPKFHSLHSWQADAPDRIYVVNGDDLKDVFMPQENGETSNA